MSSTGALQLAAGELGASSQLAQALPAAVLAVGTVHLDDPDAGRGDVTGQAGSVAAGALDPTRHTVPNPPSQPSRPA
jgi:hypothetical protein